MSDNKSSHDIGKIGLATIWAIGVGSALGGDFFGWQVCYITSFLSLFIIIHYHYHCKFVLYGGFGSATLATIFSALLYWLYAGTILTTF
jgi:hypothetical protein